MDPLATQDDLAALLGRNLTDDEEARADGLLKGASARVRAYTRRVFTPVEGDEITLRPVGTVVRLPQRPVTEVTSVYALASDGTPDVELSGWVFDGVDKIDIAPACPAEPTTAPLWWCHPDAYRVTYSHGDAEVPDVVVDVVASMVLRTLLAPTQTPGMVSERVGIYNYQLQQSGGSPGASVRMLQEDRDALDDAGYRRRVGTIGVRAG
ncbi:hypothetical protein F4561_006561 [Lipingzhangella halophila]|uniref:Head-to-tail adaptor n=1 Tax=Lipingzhangella halophila TaxID=1783352 RepID=A0A7W7W5W6_9ACTN|nr:hypothetical protein [Lipingzhangella halophila]MBB4935652.1 hypothetical protein [Lipingzhangella halophila]